MARRARCRRGGPRGGVGADRVARAARPHGGGQGGGRSVLGWTLSEERLEPLRAAVRAMPGVREIYLTRRVVVEMPEVPCYFVGVVPASVWWKLRRKIEGVQLRDSVIGAAEWPDNSYFVVCEGSHAGLARRMKKVAGARLIAASAGSAASSQVDQAGIEALREELVRRRGRRRRSPVALYAGLFAAALHCVADRVAPALASAGGPSQAGPALSNSLQVPRRHLDCRFPRAPDDYKVQGNCG
jgi:hypothetical protein